MRKFAIFFILFPENADYEKFLIYSVIFRQLIVVLKNLVSLHKIMTLWTI
jgi:hypothetical protein